MLGDRTKLRNVLMPALAGSVTCGHELRKKRLVSLGSRASFFLLFSFFSLFFFLFSVLSHVKLDLA